MDDNNFTMRQIVQHHYFSGKDCPQTMRTEGYWNHFMKLVEVEYQILQYKKMGFTFELTPLTKYVISNGRVIDTGTYLPVKAIFEVKITDSKGESLSKVFSSSIPPRK